MEGLMLMTFCNSGVGKVGGRGGMYRKLNFFVNFRRVRKIAKSDFQLSHV